MNCRSEDNLWTRVLAYEWRSKELKRTFGRELVFWGGGVDAQCVLTNRTPAQVKDNVRRRIEDLAPGGGFIFAPVHNTQGNVPPQNNILAMWEALARVRELFKDLSGCKLIVNPHHGTELL